MAAMHAPPSPAGLHRTTSSILGDARYCAPQHEGYSTRRELLMVRRWKSTVSNHEAARYHLPRTVGIGSRKIRLGGALTQRRDDVVDDFLDQQAVIALAHHADH